MSDRESEAVRGPADGEPDTIVAADAKAGGGEGAAGAAIVAGSPSDTSSPPGSPVRNTVTIRLARFEGPLDLLLHLIKRDEVDIYDIPISHITQQYLAYIELMRALDLEVAGDFLVMAATLMRIKAKMLLPLPSSADEEEEGDPREELVQRLVEYRQFKEAAGTLKEKEGERRLLFERGMLPGDDEAGPLPLASVSLFDLLDALNRVMSRVPEVSVYEVETEEFDVDDKMSLIASTVAEHGSVPFATLLLRCRARSEMIVTFMALLELIKLGNVSVIQTEAFGEIMIVHRPAEGISTDAADTTAARD